MLLKASAPAIFQDQEEESLELVSVLGKVPDAFSFYINLCSQTWAICHWCFGSHRRPRGFCLVTCPLKIKELCTHPNWPNRGMGQQEPLVRQELSFFNAAISKTPVVSSISVQFLLIFKTFIF